MNCTIFSSCTKYLPSALKKLAFEFKICLVFKIRQIIFL